MLDDDDAISVRVSRERCRRKNRTVYYYRAQVSPDSAGGETRTPQQHTVTASRCRLIWLIIIFRQELLLFNRLHFPVAKPTTNWLPCSVQTCGRRSRWWWLQTGTLPIITAICDLCHSPYHRDDGHRFYQLLQLSWPRYPLSTSAIDRGQTRIFGVGRGGGRGGSHPINNIVIIFDISVLFNN